MVNYKKETKNILYEFSIILERENDLLHLYFVSLSIMMIAFDLKRCILFRYSEKKQCFEPKIGLSSKDIQEIAERWKTSKISGEFAEYMLNLDISKLYETSYNRQVGLLNIPCNDVTRSILNPFAAQNEKTINIADINNKYVTRILTDIEMDNSLYLPLMAKNSSVGFMLINPPVANIEELKAFSVGLGLTMSIFIKDRELDSLKEIIDYNKEDIEHKQKLYEIGKTASTITHEIKNSLIGIIGLFNKLKEYIIKSEKTEKYVKIIDNELNRMYRFAVDINKYSSNYTSSNKEMLDLKEIVDKAIDMTSNINNKFVFSVCIDKKASVVFGDRNRLEQVLINLLKNSIEAYRKKDGGRIRIKAKRDGDYIILKIRDNSGGVDDEKLQEITKPFYTTKAHGTGLGLSIVKEIIKEHGGDIDFRNTKDGLECTIKLPAPKNIVEDKDG